MIGQIIIRTFKQRNNLKWENIIVFIYKLHFDCDKISLLTNEKMIKIMFKSVSNSVSGEEDEFLNIKKTDEMKDRKGIALISDSKSKRKKKFFSQKSS